MNKIAICDDEAAICSQIEQAIKNTKNNLNADSTLFYSSVNFYEILKSGENFDLVFLDIEFQTLDGIEIGRLIREELKNDDMHIVYISGKDDYAMRLFENRPIHFLVKPLTEEKIIASSLFYWLQHSRTCEC